MTDAARRSIYVAVCAGAIAFALAMIVGATGEPRELPWYEPLQHRWITSRNAPTPVAMDYYARVGTAFAFAIGVGALGARLARRRELSPTLTRALGVWAWALLALSMFLYAHALLTRHIEPPPTAPTRGL